MLVRSISVKNIRSYNDGRENRLDVPEGVILLEGDIGSGKSTLLYALEFALFGFSDMKGTHLLSEGRREGHVSVTFESGGSAYAIDRGLRAKGEDVVQEECYITEDGRRTKLSPSDLKERVVSILGFNEPTHPKAESLVYRYAVFTPQEQMKEILLQKPDERLHVIRRVLGAQSYQVAAENSDLVAKEVKAIAYGLKKASEDLEEKKDELEEESKAVASLESEIPGLEKGEADAGRTVRMLEADQKESIAIGRSLGKLEGKIPELKEGIAHLESSIASDQRDLADLEGELAEVEKAIRAFEGRKGPDARARSLQAKLDSAKEQLAKFLASREALGVDLAKTKDLISKGVCPLCGQRVSGDLHEKTEHVETELRKVEEEAASAARAVDAISESLDYSRQYEEEESDNARAMKDQSRLEVEIKGLTKKLKDNTGRLSRHRSDLEKAESEVKAMEEASEKLEALEMKLKAARNVERDAGLALNQARTELAERTRGLRRLAEEVKKKQEAVDRARRLSSYQSWLSTFFRPSVEMIEKQTLARAASRFNHHFQRFFSSLVEDPEMVVRVKEDFSPLFEREGFEQDFEALSGGERTSMALAYRFALNSVVRESVATQPELVVLDEPTDGFSKEQVYKMRALLDELDSRQVILVSHEKELESMADHIFRVEKRNGTSVVSDIAA